MALSLKEIAERVNGELVGDGELMIDKVAPIDRARPGDITFVSNPKYIQFARTTEASAIIVSPSMRDLKRNLIVTPNPYLAFAKVVAVLMEKKLPHRPGVHPSAIVAPGARLGRDVSIRPHVVIEEDAEIGARATLMAGVFIGRGVSVGDETVIHPNTSIYFGTRIGKRCIIHSNVVIGSDGFGWAPSGRHYERIPQVGITDIGDDVSVGATTVINRGALGNTTIGRGTKIDSLVVISHNVEIGEDCLFVSQVGISGSVKIGHHVSLGGQVGVAGHLKIGDNVQVAAQSGVTHDMAANGIYFGSPARPIQEMKRTVAALRRLPELRKEIRRVQKSMAEITAMLGRDVGAMTKSGR